MKNLKERLKRIKRTFPSKEAAVNHMYAGGTSSNDLARYFKGMHKMENIHETVEEMIQKKRIHIK